MEGVDLILQHSCALKHIASLNTAGAKASYMLDRICKKKDVWLGLLTGIAVYVDVPRS